MFYVLVGVIECMAIRKDSYFWKPQHSGLDVLDREDISGAVYATPKDLMRVVDRSGFDIAVIVETDSEPVLPIGEGTRYYSGVNWLKRGPERKLVLPRSLRQMQDEKLSPRRARVGLLDALGKEVDESGEFPWVSGYVYSTPDGKGSTKLHLHYALGGTDLFRFTQLSGERNRIKVERKSHSHAERKKYGASFDVTVPSRSSDDSYVFRFVHVPADNVDEQHVIWRSTSTEGHMGGKKIGRRHTGCEKKFYGEDTHRGPIGRQTFCDHEIAAQYALAQHIQEKNKFFPLQPAPWASEALYQFWYKLRHNVVVEDVAVDKRGVKRRRKRPINGAETEPILWQWAIEHRSENPFYASGKKVKDYERGFVPVPKKRYILER